MAAKRAKTIGKFKPVYVIAGKDNFLTSTECQSLLDKILPLEQRPLALLQVEADKADIADVFDELRTLPFLAQKRVVLIKGADKFVSNYRENLETYFDKPSGCGVLILVVSTWAKNTRLAKKLPQIGELIDISEFKPWQLPGYAADYARSKHNKILSKSSASILVELVGDDPGRLVSEIDKLAVFSGEQKTISAKDIESLIGHNRMFNAFGVIDAITAGDMAGALGRLRNMFATDKNADYTTVGAFAFHFRRMFNAKAMLDNGDNPKYIAGKLRIFYNKEAFFRQLKKTTLKTLGSILEQLARIDYSIKTGQTTAKVAIEKLVLGMSKN